ncbi:prepilin-type N-terminal cleavage/methylation domain-containing protein, partial [bacterium]|nr:prepilin-type N-terminal cleavage/methylation domain-containing protein [bacterium]
MKKTKRFNTIGSLTPCGDKNVQPLRRGEVELRHCEEDVSPTKQSSLFCHSELVSESISKKILNQVQHDRGKYNSSPEGEARWGASRKGKYSCCPLTQTLSRRARAGFTLAEVLITIGVIGVVAAMTIPSLMQGIGERSNSE